MSDAWDWEGGSGPGRSKSGTVNYDLTIAVPSGVPITVEGYHSEAGVNCSGSVTIEVEGGLFDTPYGAGALGGTAVALAGLGFAMVPKRGGAA